MPERLGTSASGRRTTGLKTKNFAADPSNSVNYNYKTKDEP